MSLLAVSSLEWVLLLYALGLISRYNESEIGGEIMQFLLFY